MAIEASRLVLFRPRVGGSFALGERGAYSVQRTALFRACIGSVSNLTFDCCALTISNRGRVDEVWIWYGNMYFEVR